MELVRTDRINVVYILNLLKNVHKDAKTAEDREKDLDLILREIERSDNESMRAKKDIMMEFVRTRFYDLPDDADIQAAYEEFEKDREKADIEAFAFENGIDSTVVSELIAEYRFNGSLTDEGIRKKLTPYPLGLLKTTKLTAALKQFIVETHEKYKAEGD